MLKRVGTYKTLVAVAALAVGVAASVTSASATVILSDNFNADTAALNWTGDAVFASGGTTAVDLVGPGTFGLLVVPPASGNSVDLNGTTGHQGDLTSVASVPAGTYTLTFLLAGPNPGSVDAGRAGDTALTTVTVGGVTIGTFTPPNTQAYTPESITFTTSGGKLEFAESLSTNKYVGDLLDNVVVATVSSGVPEPSTWALMLLGFVGLGFAGYRSSKPRLTLRA
jgi:hypothetical protein